MDVGKFKASRSRLIAWTLIPPVLIVGVGLSAYALQLQSKWQLERTKGLATVLPKLILTQNEAKELLREFGESGIIESEDQLISFLQGVAQKTGFSIDSLKVDRSSKDSSQAVLIARVKGTGTFLAIESFVGDVNATQPLLSETAMQVSRIIKSYQKDQFNAEITFELVMFKAAKAVGGTK